METLTEGTTIDEETSESIYDWYRYRRVCDNDRFPLFFRRQLALVDRQYMQLLRLELTEWDPMVAEYMERQITRAETGENSGGGTRTTTADTTTTTTKTDSGQDKTTTDTKRDSTSTDSGTDTTTATRDTTDARTVEMTRTNDLTGTRTDDLTVTSDSTTHREGTSGSKDGGTVTKGREYEGNANRGERTLNGATPDSETYTDPAPSQPIPGMPSVLSWRYTSSQTQSDAAENRKENTTDTETRELEQSENTNVDGTDHTTTVNGGTVTDKQTGTVTDSGSDTTKRTGSDTTTVERGTKNVTTVTDGGTRTTDYGKQSVTEAKDGGTTTVEDSTSGTSKRDEDTRERYSGRHEAPPELLRKAQTYLLGSNSLKWLLAQLETCFHQIFDEEEYDYGC